ncbi:MAG TPA: ferredoxin, partial [Clostridiales bacterium]|nr:ferredoxin [Clostridiales bacterium]
MSDYKHSVSLDVEKCKGCTHCLKRCPTEAIRIRDGHAKINADRCIDCGVCIRICPYKAKKAIFDKPEVLQPYKWKIALPPPSL